MKSKFFKQQSTPITSQEAFEILSCTQVLSDIEDILFHFRQLVDIKKSTLTSHALLDSKIPNNREFIKNLEGRFQKMKKAVEEGVLYPTLFGDVCKIKEDLGVILAYYQAQIREQQPVVNNYLRSAQSQKGELSSSISRAVDSKKSLLDKKDSNHLTKYVINFCAPDIMRQDIEKIAKIVQNPFLADHSDEPDFSYLK